MRIAPLLSAIFLVIGTTASFAEIIDCPTAFSPRHRDCTVLTDPVGRPQAAQRCERADCRARPPRLDAAGRKVCAFTCFQHFQ